MVNLFIMIPDDIIVYISNFTLIDRLYLLDKDIYNRINIFNQSKKWYKIYQKYFNKNNINLKPINYSLLNWKKEYSKIKNFKYWNLFGAKKEELIIKNNFKNLNFKANELNKKIENYSKYLFNLNKKNEEMKKIKTN